MILTAKQKAVHIVSKLYKWRPLGQDQREGLTDTHDADGLDPDVVEEVVGPVKRVAGKT